MDFIVSSLSTFTRTMFQVSIWTVSIPGLSDDWNCLYCPIYRACSCSLYQCQGYRVQVTVRLHRRVQLPCSCHDMPSICTGFQLGNNQSKQNSVRSCRDKGSSDFDYAAKQPIRSYRTRSVFQKFQYFGASAPDPCSSTRWCHPPSRQLVRIITADSQFECCSQQVEYTEARFIDIACLRETMS